MKSSNGTTIVDGLIYAQKPVEQSIPDYRRSSLPTSLHARAEEIIDHCKLTDAVIGEINSTRYRLNAGIRYRAQENVLQSHYEGWCADWNHYEIGRTRRYDYFGKHPLLVGLHHHGVCACTDTVTQQQYWVKKDPQNTCQDYSLVTPATLQQDKTLIPRSLK